MIQCDLVHTLPPSKGSAEKVERDPVWSCAWSWHRTLPLLWEREPTWCLFLLAIICYVLSGLIQSSLVHDRDITLWASWCLLGKSSYELSDVIQCDLVHDSDITRYPLPRVAPKCDHVHDRADRALPLLREREPTWCLFLLAITFVTILLRIIGRDLSSVILCITLWASFATNYRTWSCAW